ncbi:hypothetical protein ACX3O0_09700 [Homoserinimonas sp. A447]
MELEFYLWEGAAEFPDQQRGQLTRSRPEHADAEQACESASDRMEVAFEGEEAGEDALRMRYEAFARRG